MSTVPVTVSVDTSALLRAGGVLGREPARIERELRTLVQHRATLAKAALQRATPVSHPAAGSPLPEHTPHMRDLWHQDTTGPAQSVVFNEAPYTGYLFSGTQAHEITARNARTLHFYAGGSEIFTGSVQHPGTAPVATLVRARDSQAAKAASDLEAYGLTLGHRLAVQIQHGGP